MAATNLQSYSVLLPADKSLTHRFILFAALAKGVSVIKNPSLGADCLATRRAVEAFSVSVRPIDLGEADDDVQWVVGSFGSASWKNPTKPIDAGNSGTTARLLIGIGVGVPDLEFNILGDESLSNRPMGRIAEPLISAGGVVIGLHRQNYLPLAIKGRFLKGFNIRSDVISAQVKSALLFAASLAHGSSTIDVPEGTRGHTENIMKALGASISWNAGHGRVQFQIKGPWSLSPFEVTVPKDPSAMAFFAVLAFINPGIKIHCEGVLANEERTYFLEILKRSGLLVKKTMLSQGLCPGEDVADYEFVRGEQESPVTVSAAEVRLVIDEIPALAIAATKAQGISTFQGLDELRIKESDRFIEILRLLTVAGVKTEAEGSNLRVFSLENPVNAFKYESFDHRMVMAASILSTLAEGCSDIGNLEAVNVSFPYFFRELLKIGV